MFVDNYITIPPQTLMVCPLIYADSSLAKNRTQLATSSGFPPRFKGIPLTHSAFTSSLRLYVISVSIKPGAMALQRMFLEPNSFATDFVKPIIPALEAA